MYVFSECICVDGCARMLVGGWVGGDSPILWEGKVIPFLLTICFFAGLANAVAAPRRQMVETNRMV